MATAAANGARTIRATWLRRIRQNRHLTQAQLAKAVGITANQVSRYEHARDDPGLDVFDRLMVALECWYSDLLADPAGSPPQRRVMHRPTTDVLESAIEVMECRCHLICKFCGLPFHRKHRCYPNPAASRETVC
jgi:transcriptional regulator with XRE-family HTH domain